MSAGSALKNVILSNPTLLDPVAVNGNGKRSWIQLAKCGSFVSNRYGEFSITKDDLTQMLRNFSEVTPKRRPSCRRLRPPFHGPEEAGDGIAARLDETAGTARGRGRTVG